MKKQILSAVLATAIAAPAMAGGLLTNTNQNAAFLRNFAQEGQIDITALYANPAGTAFLNNGWHLSLNNQTAFQKRLVDTTFPLFAFDLSNPGAATHHFKGTAAAPAIPSFQLSYNQDKWSVNASFALVGGGGKCTFEDGLGSFEAAYAGNIYSSLISPLNAGLEGINQAMPGAGLMAGYKMDKYMKGTSYNFGLQVGGTYKVLDNLSFFAGVRFVYAMTNYQGHVNNISADVISTTGNDAAVAFAKSQPAIAGGLAAGNAQLAASYLEMDCDQSGFGVTPIIGVDWKINNQWNVSAKYEFKTRMRLGNSTKMSPAAQAMCDPTSPNYNPTIANYKDGGTVKDDVPGILALGVQYKPIENLKLNVGYHWFQDSKATKNGNMHNYVHDSHEVLAGVEYKFCKWVAVSASWQKTMYDMEDDFMNDVSFNNSSNSIGCGFRIYPHKIVDIDLGYMHTFYQAKTVGPTVEKPMTNVYNRKNDVFGIGVNLHF